ncbi:hypothetical protein B9N36_26315 [Escherichia coli]|nr:hypothetical protein [Shigella sonnei]EFY1141756.1 hypothetical protein [Shigella flexneri]EGD9388667.1 hypothetical protein [Escherichia coli]EGD9388868.1 hypothetical protein [Escherichia coli]RBT89280.1 hypothetical protein B9N37_25930 [Escherichia coli]
MGSCAAPSAKGDDKFITTDYLQQCPAHETITLVNASIILKKEEYEYSTFSCRPYSLFCGILPSCFCSPRNAGESKRC